MLEKRKQCSHCVALTLLKKSQDFIVLLVLCKDSTILWQSLLTEHVVTINTPILHSNNKWHLEERMAKKNTSLPICHVVTPKTQWFENRSKMQHGICINIGCYLRVKVRYRGLVQYTTWFFFTCIYNFQVLRLIDSKKVILICDIKVPEWQLCSAYLPHVLCCNTFQCIHCNIFWDLNALCTLLSQFLVHSGRNSTFMDILCYKEQAAGKEIGHQ
jgi:hypothetical protein